MSRRMNWMSWTNGKRIRKVKVKQTRTTLLLCLQLTKQRRPGHAPLIFDEFYVDWMSKTKIVLHNKHILDLQHLFDYMTIWWSFLTFDDFLRGNVLFHAVPSFEVRLRRRYQMTGTIQWVCSNSNVLARVKGGMYILYLYIIWICTWYERIRPAGHGAPFLLFFSSCTSWTNISAKHVMSYQAVGIDVSVCFLFETLLNLF